MAQAVTTFGSMDHLFEDVINLEHQMIAWVVMTWTGGSCQESLAVHWWMTLGLHMWRSWCQRQVSSKYKYKYKSNAVGL